MFRRSGGWAFRIDIGYQPTTGNRRQMLRQGFATKRAAERAMTEAVAENSKGTVVSRTTLRVVRQLVEMSMVRAWVSGKSSARCCAARAAPWWPGASCESMMNATRVVLAWIAVRVV
jgi:hypothetical protein